MTIQHRAYRGEEDFQRVRELLIESLSITKRIHNWWLDRWEICRFGGNVLEELAGTRSWEADVHVWEEVGQGAPKLVGVVNPEDGGDFFLQVHPHYRRIEDEMLAWVDQHHRAKRPQDAERWVLNTFAYEYDVQRAALLRRWGYEDRGPCEYARTRSLDAPIPELRLPNGYSVRSMQNATDEDWARRAAVANASFNSSRHTAETVQVLQRAPSYHLDLDLATVAPDGTFASFCIVWFGAENRRGWYEPVGTHPEHRRLGLASAVINEGLRRIKALGAMTAGVGSGYGSPANRLYEATGFVDYEVGHHWQKEF